MRNACGRRRCEYWAVALRDTSIKSTQRRLCAVASAEYGLIISPSRCEKASKQITKLWLLTPHLCHSRVEVVSHALRMAGVKLKLQPRHARLFDTHAKGEPRQRIAHLYQTIRMRPAIFGKYVKDMDNVKPACAVIFRR
jgi:hypothetical protein